MKSNLPVEVVCNLMSDLIKGTGKQHDPADDTAEPKYPAGGSRELNSHFRSVLPDSLYTLLTGLVTDGTIVAFHPRQELEDEKHPGEDRVSLFLRRLPTGATQEEEMTLHFNIQDGKIVTLSSDS